MQIEITYSKPQKHKLQRAELIERVKWLFLLAAYLCPIINLCIGGSAWSVIVLWSLWIAWTFVFAPDVIEYNCISQFIKLIVHSCALFVLIDVFLSPGWAITPAAIVCFAGLILVAILLFSDFERQKHNMLPILLFSVVSLLFAAFGAALLPNHGGWVFATMGMLAASLLLVLIFIFGKDTQYELKKMFHVR